MIRKIRWRMQVPVQTSPSPNGMWRLVAARRECLHDTSTCYRVAVWAINAFPRQTAIASFSIPKKSRRQMLKRTAIKTFRAVVY